MSVEKKGKKLEDLEGTDPDETKRTMGTPRDIKGISLTDPDLSDEAFNLLAEKRIAFLQARKRELQTKIDEYQDEIDKIDLSMDSLEFILHPEKIPARFFGKVTKTSTKSKTTRKYSDGETRKPRGRQANPVDETLPNIIIEVLKGSSGSLDLSKIVSQIQNPDLAKLKESSQKSKVKGIIDSLMEEGRIVSEGKKPILYRLGS